MLLDGNLLRQTSKHRLAFGLTIITGIFSGGFIVLQARITAELINAIVFLNTPISSLGSPLILLLAVIILRAISQFFTEILSAKIGLIIKEKLRKLLIEKIQKFGPVYSSGERKGELLTVLTNGIEALDPYFSQYIPQMILAGFIPVIIAVSIFPLDILSFVILLVTAPILPFFMYLLGSLSERSTKKQWNQLVRLGSYFYDTIQGMILLISLNQNKTRGEEIHKKDLDYQNLTMGVLKLTFLSAFVLEFIATISTAVIAVEIGLRLLSGNLTFVVALFTLLLAPEFYLPLRQLGVKFHAGMSGRAASIKIFSLLSEDDHPGVRAIPDSLAGSSQPAVSDHLSSGYFPIIFDKVSARYPGSDEMVLKDISFQINKFEKIAIVGKSGVGKTSLSYVLMRLLNHSIGDIYLGTNKLLDIQDEDLRNLFTWVPQNPFIFFGTVLENITMFQNDPDLSRIDAAINNAKLSELISELPDGTHTVIGERGFQISVGQAQRIAVARAYYRDTPIIVMDEPTSSIDPETERVLIESLKKLMIKKTVIMIVHRLSTIVDCDRILVLQNGEIIESGNHRELISRRGCYSQLVMGGSYE